MTSRVVMMCGPSGSGKTTVARELEAAGMVRLSYDAEFWRRGLVAHPVADDVADEVEAVLRARLLELVAAGTDVVLDFAFWSRARRAAHRELLATYDVEIELVHLATPRQVCLDRVAARDNGAADEIRLPDDLAASHWDHFEVPTPDEGPLTVLGG